MNWAIFCDLNSINISYQMFYDAISKLDGKIVYAKFYGYVASKHKGFLEYIKNTQAELCLPIHSKRKSTIDIRQCIDAVLYMSRSDVDGAFIICAEVDCLYMIKTIKSLNKKVVIAKMSKSEIDDYCDDVIYLKRSVNVEFLPYSGVEGKIDEMQEIKQKLDLMIENKLKNRENEFASSDEIEKLLKKYF